MRKAPEPCRIPSKGSFIFVHPHPVRFVFLFLLLFASVILLGIRIPFSYSSGPGTLSLQVLIEYRGAFEREIERILTMPLENALSEIRGVEEIFSLSEPGQSRVHLILSEGSDLEEAYLETREAVDRLFLQFPPAVQRPLILRSDPRNDPVFIAAFPLNSDVSEEELKRRFQAVEGVGEVEVGGGTREEMVIRWIPDRGMARKIHPLEMGEAVRSWNVSGGFGNVSGLPMNLHRLLSSPESIGQVPLRTILQVKDVTEVTQRQVPQDRKARVNGEAFLVLYLKPSGDGNLLRLSEQLTSLCRSIPGSSILYDQGKQVRCALEELLWAWGIGVACVVILTGFFLQTILPALLVSLSIPFSSFSALAFLYLLGKPLDFVCLSALTVGSGLVIDSGVILVDRFLQEVGFHKGKVSQQTRDPILLSTLTTVGVFLPLIFASPSIRFQFESLTYTLCAQLGASLLYTLGFLPVFLTSIPAGRASSVSPLHDRSHGLAGTPSLRGCLGRFFFFCIPRLISFGPSLKAFLRLIPARLSRQPRIRTGCSQSIGQLLGSQPLVSGSRQPSLRPGRSQPVGQQLVRGRGRPRIGSGRSQPPGQPLVSGCHRSLIRFNGPRLLIITAFLFLFGGGVILLHWLPKGKETLDDPTQLSFLIEFDSGVPLEQVMARCEPLERFLMDYPGVPQVRVKYERERASFSLDLSTSLPGASSARLNPKSALVQKSTSIQRSVLIQKSTAIQKSASIQNSPSIQDPELVHRTAGRKFREKLIQEVQQKASTISQGFLFLPDSARGGSSISVVLNGQDTLTLQDLAVDFAHFLQDKTKHLKTIEPPGIVFHFKEPLPSKRILIDPLRSNRAGLTPFEIRDYLYTSLSEPVIDKSLTANGEIDIRLSFLPGWIRSSQDLISLSLPGPQGMGVRVSDVCSMEEKKTPRRIYRTNRRRSASFTVLSELKDPAPLLTILREEARNYPFPEGVTVEIGREWEATSRDFRENLFLLGLSFCVLLLILCAFYQEIPYPLLVILQLPLFLSFAVWALWIFQIPFSLSVAVGFLLTGGIGVNNALLVFPVRRSSMNLPASPLKHFQLSFRSMLTATLTTMAGSLPLFFQGGLFTGQIPWQNRPFAGLSLVVAAGSVGSFLVLWGVVLLMGKGPTESEEMESGEPSKPPE